MTYLFQYLKFVAVFVGIIVLSLSLIGIAGGFGSVADTGTPASSGASAAGATGDTGK